MVSTDELDDLNVKVDCIAVFSKFVARIERVKETENRVQNQIRFRYKERSEKNTSIPHDLLRLRYHRLDVCTLALDLLTNSTVGDGVASITFQLLPIILVRRLSEEFLKPAFTIMSSELASKNTLLKNFAKGKNSFYRYYLSNFGSLVLIS